MNYNEIIKNLRQIQSLCKEDSPMIAAERIEFLITDIKDHQNKLTFWDVLTGKKS